MTLHQLRLYVTVAETRNLSLASARLRISQPAVTKQLKALSQELGKELYVTTGRGVRLTRDGERFLEHAHNVLAAVANIERDFGRNATDQGRLAIGACYPASASLLPAVMGRFLELFPDVRVNIVTDVSAILARALVNRAVDVVVALRPPNAEGIKHEIVSYYTPVLVGPSEHPLTRKDTVTVEDLAHVPLITQRQRLVGEKVMELIRASGVVPHVVMECLNPEGVKTAVKSGFGFGILFAEHIAAELRAGLLKPVNLPLLQELRVPCFAMYRDREPLSVPLQGFIGVLRRYRAAQLAGC